MDLEKTVGDDSGDRQVPLDVREVRLFLGRTSALAEMGHRAAQLAIFGLDLDPCVAAGERNPTRTGEDILYSDTVDDRVFRLADKRADLAVVLTTLRGVATRKVSDNIGGTSEMPNRNLVMAEC